MLTREIMGLLALGILWVNSALVFAVALKQLGNVRALRKRLVSARAEGALVTGIARADGERFAVRRITQLGRAITTRGPDRILFTDGPQAFEVLGGSVETEGEAIRVAPAHGPEAEVWLGPARTLEGTACEDGGTFERAWAEATTFKGFAQDVELEVRSGDRVWVLGAREGDAIAPAGDAPLVVSMIDPVAFAASRARVLTLFLILGITALVGVTAVALTPPRFGLLSTLGGALGLAYFLAIQPLGTAVRDAVKTPARALVGALWRRPGS